MSELSDQDALEFGERLVALLDSGRFTATYKRAGRPLGALRWRNGRASTCNTKCHTLRS